MDCNVFFSLLPLLWGLHFSTGSPLVGIAVTNSPDSSARQTSSSSARRLSRAKRCSCSSFLDKECIYFCHLDIIWINTPERIVPYGLGSVPRAKRSLKENWAALGRRCECGSRDDRVCYQFCEDEQHSPRFSVKAKVQKQNTVQASDRMDHNKPKCTGLKCVYHLLNTIKRLESANNKHLPTSMKWIYRIRKVRQDSHDKLKRFPVSMAGPVVQCRDCKR